VDDYLQKVSAAGRQAAQSRDWSRVRACGREIIGRQGDSAEGWFLLGLAEKASGSAEQAINAFSRTIRADDGRYDAAVELAELYLSQHRYGEAVALLKRHEAQMENSPRYLNMAGSVYVKVGLPELALPLYLRADELQPGIDSIRANLAACSTYVGRIDEAIGIYRELLAKYPHHQRNHYELSRLGRATDESHIEQMKAALDDTRLPPAQNIYLYYALGKELEDLEQWDEAFEYYRLAGDAAASVANYDVSADIRLIDKVIEVCDEDWLKSGCEENPPALPGKSPVFIVGLPRSGTTLTERILSSHSRVESAGESFFMQIAIKQHSGIASNEPMNAEMIEGAAKADIGRIGNYYLQSIAYRLGAKPLFIEKLPENFLYLGFIAKAFPNAKLVHLNRNPMDSCFAMYKQSFFRYAYRLEDLGQYYVAYKRLHEHWQRLLGPRLIEVGYEALVSDLERQTRKLLDELGLDFEASCLNFEKNAAASNTASTVQVRERAHTRSVHRWKHFARQLQPLRSYLEACGIAVE